MSDSSRCIHLSIDLSISAHTHTHTHARTHAHTRTHTHTNAENCRQSHTYLCASQTNQKKLTLGFNTATIVEKLMEEADSLQAQEEMFNEYELDHLSLKFR